MYQQQQKKMVAPKNSKFFFSFDRYLPHNIYKSNNFNQMTLKIIIAGEKYAEIERN